MSTIGFIGGGNMAEALIKGIVTAEVYAPQDVLVSDIRAERLEFLADRYGVTAAASNSELASKVETIVLSVKPQMMIEVLEGVKDAIAPGAPVVSIAAGITVGNISAVLGEIAIIRVMPNTPALIGEGVSALFANEQAKPVELGLPEDVAKDLVLQTARGAGLLATEADKNGEGPAELRRKVTSPGGTTEAALKVFKEGKMDELVSAAITRARDRARELAK
ncbi:MAG: pyrroline-5-carboxylate reductase family protein [Planctomycetota bacterium]